MSEINLLHVLQCNIKQREGVAMGSPLSPVVSNLFMEHFERKALESFTHKPKWWLRFIDDVYSNWPHGDNRLEDFMNHLNNQSQSIKFTMEKEDNKCLPFLDVLTMKKQDGSFTHQVYRKDTHTNRYLHVESHHHPAQKISFFNILATRVIRVSDRDHIAQEITHLKKALLNNGYKEKMIDETIMKSRRGRNGVRR